MTIDQYLSQFPDYDQDEETIETCLADAELTIDYLIHARGKSVPPEAREQAIGFQAALLLKHFDDLAGDCKSVSNAALAMVLKGAQIYG